MPDWMEKILDLLRERWRGEQRGRLLLLGGAGLAAVALLVFAVYWASRPDWAPLYTGLSEVEAAKVVDTLDEQGVKYRLSSGGGTVEVPRGELYRLRVKLAVEGGPSQSMPGYEILDEQRLGMSEREMEMMHKRALEGELAKTLASLEWIHAASVHIVTPKPSLFSDEHLPTTASVTVVTDPFRQPPRSEVQGVVALVASSVEGLHPSRVTVVDSQGQLLTKWLAEDELFGQSSKQIELSRKLDGYLSEVGQDVLDRVIGAGHSVVRVSAELDFSYLERTSRVFDPEKRIVRSQELNEQNSTSADTSASQEERQITNFEVNEVLEHSRGQQGAVQRLTVSLVVDGTYAEAPDEEGNPVKTYIPRSAEEMDRFGEIVKAAVGFKAQRGDVIKAHTMPFSTSDREEDLSLLRRLKMQSVWMDILRKAVFVGGIIAFLLLLRSTIHLTNLEVSRAFDDKRALILATAKGESEEVVEEEVPLMLEAEASRSPAQRQMMRVHKKVTDFCLEHPEEAARFVRCWLQERD